MEPIYGKKAGRDPCLTIQVDLSCMVDGELDDAAVRRVLVHTEVCASCGAFLRAIRSQALAQSSLAAVHALDGPRKLELMARRLVQGRLKELASVFYQLGRSYVLLVVSQDYRRLISREPVPIPEFRLRGRALIEEIAGSAPAARDRLMGAFGERWVKARSLLNGKLDSDRDNLDKGRSLLEEALVLRPRLHAARIFLGHALQIAGEGRKARRQFRRVLRTARGAVARAFALENLGSSYLADGRPDRAAAFFRRLIASGVIERDRRFFTAWLNLAAASARTGNERDCVEAFATLHERFQEKREWVGGQIASHQRLVRDLRERPALHQALRSRMPEWFSQPGGAAAGGGRP